MFFAGVASCLALWSDPAFAGARLDLGKGRFINFGAGLRVGYTGTHDTTVDKPKVASDFAVQNARLYLSGQAHEKFKLTFNTELIWGQFDILDAIVQFEPHPAFNIWIGRMLTPADRIEMNGPYYGLSWNQYTVPLYPSDQSNSFATAGAYGRDEGLTIWGDLGKFQYALGVFDGYHGPNTSGDPLLLAGRVAYNFLNKEKNPGYYTSSTYHGKAGDILTLALSGQYQNQGASFVDTTGNPRSTSFKGLSADLLFEKVLRGGNVLNLDGEFKLFDCKCGPERRASPGFTLFDGMSTFATAGFLIGPQIGPGQLQPYLRHTANIPDSGPTSHLTEFGTNYVIDGHNLRLNLNLGYGDANASGYAGNRSLVFALGAQYQL